MRTYTRRRPECQVIKGVRDLCRLCLQKSEETVEIFDENSDNICAALALRIMICVGLEVTREDSLPNMICIECYRELSRYYAFRRKCELSYQKLKLHIQAVKEECLHNIVNNKEDTNEETQIDNLSSNVTGLCDVDKTECTVTCETARFNNNGNCGLNGVKESDSKIISPSDDDNLDISTFLSSILIQLGVIKRDDDKLTLLDPNVNTLELTTGDDNSVTFQLMEEGDEEVNGCPNSEPVDKSQTTEHCYSENSNNKLEQTIHNSPEVTNGTGDGQITTVKGGEVGAGGGGRAWCPECRKWLASAGTLRRHALVHTGERPYPCRECGRAFAQRESLKRHRTATVRVRPMREELHAAKRAREARVGTRPAAVARPDAAPVHQVSQGLPLLVQSESSHAHALRVRVHVRRMRPHLRRQELVTAARAQH